MDLPNEEEREDSSSANLNLVHESSGRKRKLDARGAPKGSNTKLKETGLSKNPATVRARERRRNLSPNSQAIRRAENADRNAISTLVKRIKGTRGKDERPYDQEYADAATEAERKAILKLRIEEYMSKRFADGTSEEAVRARVYAEGKDYRQHLKNKLHAVASSGASAQRAQGNSEAQSAFMKQALSMGYFQGMKRRIAVDTSRFMQKVLAPGGIELQAMAYPDLGRKEALEQGVRDLKDYLESDYCDDAAGILDPKTKYDQQLGIDEDDQVQDQVPDELELDFQADKVVETMQIETPTDSSGDEDEKKVVEDSDDELDGFKRDGIDWFGEAVNWETDERSEDGKTSDEQSSDDSDDEEFEVEDDEDDDDDEEL